MFLRSSSSAALSCFLLLSVIDDSLSFSARKSSGLIKSISSRRRSTSSTTSALNVVSVAYADDEYAFDADGGGIYLMNRAQACADSESCSLEDAQLFLDGVLHQQKDCLGAGVLSTKTMICDNVESTVDLVATLREKIETEQRRRALITPTVHTINVVMGIYVISTIMHGFAAVPNVPIDSPLVYTTDYYSSLFEEAGNRGIVPFLPEEWIWALRDGYFPRMVMEFFQNGGLVVDTSAFDTKVVAFTPQEWIWSLQNGSFGRILQENMQYGGLVVDSASFDSTETVIPMTGQDVLLSIRDGYFGTAMSHFYRNGGL